MSDYLCLRLNSSDLDQSSVMSWVLLTAAGAVSDSGECSLSELWESLSERGFEREQIGHTIVLAPAHAALMTKVDVPAGQRRHLRQVLPFMVEEQLIEPVESMHIVTPVLLDGDSASVTVISKALLAAWLDWLSEIDLAPDYLFLDATCLPAEQGTMQAMIDGAQVLIRSEKYCGLSVPAEMAESVMSLSLARFSDIEGQGGINSPEFDLAEGLQNDETEIAVAVLQPDNRDQLRLNDLIASINAASVETDSQDAEVAPEEELALRQEALLKQINETADKLDRLIRSENIPTERLHYSETATELLAVNVVRSLDQHLNLLQGDFRPANANAQTRRIARLTGFAVAACLAVFLMVTLLGGAYLNWQADGYYDKTVALYKDVFPKQRRIRSPVKEMKRKLSGQAVGGSASEFLPLLDAASSSLATLSEESALDASIKQLRYDMQRGNIAIDIHTDTIDQLEAYKDLLSEQGLDVDILSANQDGGIVKGRIQIGRT